MRHFLFGIGLVVVYASSANAQQDPLSQDRLRVETVYRVLSERNPWLSAARRLVSAAEARVPIAGALPDPQLQFGVMNLAIPEFSDDMASSMAPAILLAQRFPFPGKLSSSERIAEYDTEIRDLGVEALTWELRAKAAGAFFDLYALDGQLTAVVASQALIDDFGSVARAMYAAGTGRQSDVLRATVEAARLSGEIARLQARRQASAARLNAMLDRPSDAPVGSPALGPRPMSELELTYLVSRADSSSPRLSIRRTSVRQADERLTWAERQIWPDLTVGFQYGQRDRGSGIERMGGVMMGISLPIFASRKQLPLRAEARAIGEAAEANLGAERAEVGAAIETAKAEIEQGRILIGLYEGEVLPQARANVESSLASYRVDRVDFPTLVDAQIALLRFQADLFRFEADLGSAWADLEAAVGAEITITNSKVTNGS